MSENGSNSGSSIAIDGDDPFARGIWILTRDGGYSMLVRVSLPNGDVDPDVTEEGLRAEMAANGFIKVIIRPCYVLSQIGFPLEGRNALGHRTGGYIPGFIPAVGKEESCMDLLYESHSFASLSWIKFLSDQHPDDVERLRLSIHNAERSAEQAIRMEKSGLVTPENVGMRG